MNVWRVLRRGAPTALVIGLAPMQIVAQMDILDLSGQDPETVIPAEFDGGFFARIGQIVVDDNGIWVIDRGHTRVFRFGREGNLLTEYGREGSGPGEFLLPGTLMIDSVLTVTDPRLGRIVRFSLEGEHLETTRQERRPVTPDGMEVPLSAVMPLPDGYLVGATAGWYSFGGRTDGEAALGDPFSHILLFHPDGAGVDTLASYHIAGGRWDAPGRLGGNVDPGLGPSGAWSVLGDSVAVLVDGIAGTLTRIRVRGGLPAADTIDLGIRARPVSDRDMADIEARLREEKPDLPRRLEFDLPEGWSVATGLVAGQSGEFWLRQAVEGDRQEWVVVRPGSIRKWRVILPEQFVLRAIHGGRLYGVATDELDVPRVAALADPRMPSGSPMPQEVIDLPTGDRQLCAAFDERFRLDGLSMVTSVGFDRQGNIRVGDFSPDGGLRVIGANSEGERLDFGLEGPGPGEFARATRMVVLADGRTVVPDPARGAFQVFLPDGRFSHQVRLGALGAESSATTFKADRVGGMLMRTTTVQGMTFDSTTLTATNSLVEGPRQVARVFLDAGEAYTEVLTRGWAPTRPTIAAEWELAGIAEGNVTSDGRVTRVALLPLFLWDAIPGGGIAFADSSSYAIKLTGPSGDVVRILRRALPSRPVTSGAQRAYRRQERDALSALMGDRRSRAADQIMGMLRSVEDMQLRAIAEMEFADEVPLVDDLNATWDGTIWVRRTPEDGFPFDPLADPFSAGSANELQQQQVGREPAPIDVVTTGGEYIGTLSAGEARLPAAFGPGGMAAYIGVDALDVPVVLVGRLTTSPVCEQQ